MNLEVRRISKEEAKAAIKRIKSGKVNGRLSCGDMNFRRETVEYSFVLWLCCDCVVLFMMLIFVLCLCSDFPVCVAVVFRTSCDCVVLCEIQLLFFLWEVRGCRGVERKYMQWFRFSRLRVMCRAVGCIKLISHSMQLWERVARPWLRGEVTGSELQYGTK